MNGIAEPTVEEARLEVTLPGQRTPVGAEIVRRGGFGAMVAGFAASLPGATDAEAAGRLVDRAGRALWQAAVARAQGGTPAGGDALLAGDDRPLYWTRLAMAGQLRRWAPPFTATGADRARWQRRFESASRGMAGADPGPAGVRRLFVSGFDPFRLNEEIRRGNPSGAAVLALDGRTLRVHGVAVRVRAVVLPVRFQDFADGIVEDAFGPHLTGDRAADLLATISQGGPGRFRLEVWNGRRRSAAIGDNLNVRSGGPGDPLVVPGIGPGPEFIASSLPLEAMAQAGDGAAFPVEIHRRVVQIPAGGTGPQEVFGDPAPGAVAVEGSGGGYLSNESAYRLTRLVLEAGARLPAGHLHTPAIGFDPANTTDLTDPAFEAGRSAVVDQVERILLAGIAAMAGG